MERKGYRLSRLNDYLEELGYALWIRVCDNANDTLCIKDIAADIITGKTPPTKNEEYYGGKYPFITIPDMHSTVWLNSTERSLSDAGNKTQIKKLIPRGSVLVSCIATLGLVGITSMPSHCNQQINAVIPKNKGDEYYLYFSMLSIKDVLRGIGATGSAAPNVNKGAFSDIEIPWPTPTEISNYVEEVKPIFEGIETLAIESMRLKDLRDVLLPKLMSGEIDVSRIDLTQLNNHLSVRLRRFGFFQHRSKEIIFLSTSASVSSLISNSLYVNLHDTAVCSLI